MEAELNRVVSTSDLRITIRKTPVHEVINRFKTNLYLNLKSRFAYVNTKQNLLAATLLDPRFKELPFEEYLGSSVLKKTTKYIIEEDLKEDSVDNDAEITDEPPKAAISSSILQKVSNNIRYLKLKFRKLIFNHFSLEENYYGETLLQKNHSKKRRCPVLIPKLMLLKES